MYQVSLNSLDYESIYIPGSLPNPPLKEDPSDKYKEIWGQMEELKNKSLVKNIGICSIDIQVLRNLLSYAKIKPSVIQIGLH